MPSCWEHTFQVHSFIVFKLLAFIARKFRANVTVFQKNVRGNVQIISGNRHVKSKVHSFICFGAANQSINQSINQSRLI